MNNIKQAIKTLASAIQDIQSRLGDNMDYSITKQVEDILKEDKTVGDVNVRLGLEALLPKSTDIIKNGKLDLKALKKSKKK